MQEFNFESVTRLERDMVKAIRELHGESGFPEMRYLVDAYYQMQELRKAADNQIRSMETEPHGIIDWLAVQVASMEKQVARALEAYAGTTPPGRWLLNQPGIGPVLAANFLAHLDVTKSSTAGGFWRFAGLDPTLEWKKGEKRPFNARLKTACWKASDSWVKLGTRTDSLYAKLYRERKAQEIERNERGEFAEQAKAKLEKFKIGKSTDAYAAYSTGKLPPAHLDARARRYVMKIFLSHLHHVMYEDHYGEAPPKPFVIEHGGHAHVIAVPGWPLAPEAN